MNVMSVDDQWIKKPSTSEPRHLLGEDEDFPWLSLSLDPQGTCSSASEGNHHESELALRNLEGQSIEVSEEEVATIVGEDVQRGFLMRLHSKMRRARFTPLKIAKGPKVASDVGNFRISLMVNPEDRRWTMEVEEWKKLVGPHDCGHPYYGITIFVDKVSDDMQLNSEDIQLRGVKEIEAPACQVD